jgi:hypothetical protein
VYTIDHSPMSLRVKVYLIFSQMLISLWILSLFSPLFSLFLNLKNLKFPPISPVL